MLTVALRQRHRNIAIIHVLIRVDDAARRAAAIVGASGVLSWPLPSIDDVRFLVAGQQASVPRGDGSSTDRPVTPADYAVFAPG